MARGDQPDLRAWSQQDPPPALEALVRQRAMTVLERRRAETASARQELRRPAAAPNAAGPSRVAAKAPGYAFELLAYGAQLTGSAARLLWRAVAG
jgi:hypothetical protein